MGRNVDVPCVDVRNKQVNGAKIAEKILPKKYIRTHLLDNATGG